MLQNLIQNAAVLIALVVLFDVGQVRTKLPLSIRNIIAGCTLGISGVLVMLMPWEYTEGIFFDTRSIVLAIGALFLGTIPTVIAVVVVAFTRLFQGGIGAWPGIGLIITSGLIGLIFRHYFHGKPESMTNLQLYLFGIIVHIPMVLWMLALPADQAIPVIMKVAIPILIMFPLGTLLAGILVKERMLLHQGQKALKESNLFNQTVLDTSPDLIYIYDLKENRNVYSSASIGEILGFTPEETLAMGDSILPTLMHPEDMNNYIEQILPRYQAARDNELIEHDYRMKNKAGQYLRLNSKEIIFKRNEDESPRQIFGILSDITEAYEMNLALQQSEKKLSDLLDGLDAGIVVHAPDTSITFSNRTAVRLLEQKSPDELTGVKAPDSRWHFVREDMVRIPVEEYPVSRILREKAQIKNVLLGSLGDDASEPRWLLVNGFPVLSENGEIQEVVVSFIDFTERVTIQKSLQQRQKLEALGTMIGGISHELNNALQSVFLYGGLLEDDLPLDEDGPADHLKDLMASAYRARDLVNQILSFGRMSDSHFQNLAIVPILEEALKLVSASMPSNIDIQTDITEDAGLIKCDKTQIHQILINLCNNARDAIGSDPGTLRIELRTGEVDLDQRGTPQPVVELTVSDTGKGIPQHQLSQVFDPFYTTKEVGEGTGLGLSVVQNLVIKMNGLINVSSQHGKGSEFKILFPRVEQDNHPEVIAESSPQLDNRLSILMIDDELPILDAARKIFSSRGMHVEIATSGAEALDLLRGFPDKYDIIISDLSMPGMSGAELTKKVRSQGIDIPIIISSGHLGITKDRELRNLGVSALIQKPWAIEEVLKKVADLTAR